MCPCPLSSSSFLFIRGQREHCSLRSLNPLTVHIVNVQPYSIPLKALSNAFSSASATYSTSAVNAQPPETSFSAFSRTPATYSTSALSTQPPETSFSAFSRTPATYSTSASVIWLWNGIAMLVLPACSVTGNIPSLRPNSVL